MHFTIDIRLTHRDFSKAKCLAHLRERKHIVSRASSLFDFRENYLFCRNNSTDRHSWRNVFLEVPLLWTEKKHASLRSSQKTGRKQHEPHNAKSVTSQNQTPSRSLPTSKNGSLFASSFKTTYIHHNPRYHTITRFTSLQKNKELFRHLVNNRQQQTKQQTTQKKSSNIITI